MKFIVDRKTWYRGKGPDKSKLLRVDGTRCCIGFVGQQCGVSDDLMLDRPGVESFHCAPTGLLPLFPAWIYTTDDLMYAYDVNDEPELSEAERESQLQSIFAKHGDEIEFVG